MTKGDGDPRPIGQLRVGVLCDLVLRPWDDTRPPVTAHLTVVAPICTIATGSAGHDACAVGHLPASGGPAGPPESGAAGTDAPGCGRAEPAEVDGHPITAAHLRELLEQLDALCPGGLQAPAGGTLSIALVDPRSGALRAGLTRREMAQVAERGCPDHPGAPCRCPVLDRPPPVDRYVPTPGQQRFLRARDRTCRHPGCRNDAGWADLDHVVPHALGGDRLREPLLPVP